MWFTCFCVACKLGIVFSFSNSGKNIERRKIQFMKLGDIDILVYVWLRHSHTLLFGCCLLLLCYSGWPFKKFANLRNIEVRNRSLIHGHLVDLKLIPVKVLVGKAPVVVWVRIVMHSVEKMSWESCPEHTWVGCDSYVALSVHKQMWLEVCHSEECWYGESGQSSPLSLSTHKIQISFLWHLL